MNACSPSVNIHRVVWGSVVISCLLYIPIGWVGASAFHSGNSSTILNVLEDTRPNLAAVISTYVFPLCMSPPSHSMRPAGLMLKAPGVLVTSIPIFAIVIRYNLLRGKICSKTAAFFWSAIFPWIVVIPFQTKVRHSVRDISSDLFRQ